MCVLRLEAWRSRLSDEQEMSEKLHMGALIISIGYWGPLYYNYNKEPPKYGKQQSSRVHGLEPAKPKDSTSHEITARCLPPVTKPWLKPQTATLKL